GMVMGSDVAELDGFDPTEETHQALAIGSTATGCDFDDIAEALRKHSEHLECVEAFEEQHGKDAVVRIRSDIFHDAIEGRLSYRDFACLCGLYSAIGSKAYARVTREQVQARMLGYRKRS